MDNQTVRETFPGVVAHGSGAIFFDGAAGTQICQLALTRMNEAMIQANSNLGGSFSTSLYAVSAVDRAREMAAQLLNAQSPKEVIFGQNMTTLTLAMSRNLGRASLKGDEIVLTRSDHDANVAPWLLLAEDLGLTVRWLEFDAEGFGFSTLDLGTVINERTALVAVNYANNVTGSINDVASVCRRAKAVGALVYVDAVQFAPHGVIDVQALGCDFLVCSAYKFYGPHHGILWGRLELLEQIKPYKARPASDLSPDKFETGTKNREAIAGIAGAIEQFAWIGRAYGDATTTSSLREQIVAGITETVRYEDRLVRLLIDGLLSLPGLTVHGRVKPEDASKRVPTISFSVQGVVPNAIARALAEQNIFVWDGHNYGLETIAALGLTDKGGVVRVSLAQYNNEAEVRRFLASLTAVLQALR